VDGLRVHAQRTLRAPSSALCFGANRHTRRKVKRLSADNPPHRTPI
jgi:hypothetical protein